MQAVLLILTKLVFGIVLGLLLIPVWVLVVLPYSAIAALFDGEPYRSALWQRMKDSASTAFAIGDYIGVFLPHP